MARRKLDIAGGQVSPPGWTNIDLWEGADIVHDLFTFPWPLEDRSVSEARCSHFVEHLPMEYVDGKDMLFAFMDEVWRILKPGGTFEVRHPHLQSERAFQDPTHRRFLPAATWAYMSADWRKANGLDHYNVDCDFEIVTIMGDGIADRIIHRAHDVQMEMAVTQWHCFADTVAILKRR